MLPPPRELGARKREEAETFGSVLLHELYFGALGGDGGTRFTGSGFGAGIPEPISAALEHDFGAIAAWRRQFVALAHALADRPGWAVLSYSRADRRLYNCITANPAEAMLDSAPIVALDLHEHAYHMDFGANVAAYIDAFMRNIDWTTVADRLLEASTGGALTAIDGGGALPSIAVEELAAALARGAPVQVLDARPKHYFSRTTDMMDGATWRDPDRIDDWISELSTGVPVVVYCAYGYAVGCGVTGMLRDRGLDAKYIRGGLAAWYASGGRRILKPTPRASE